MRPCWRLAFRLLSPRNWDRTRFCCFKPPGAEGLKPWPAAVASPQGPGCLHAAAAAQKAQASSPELWSHLGHPSTSQPQQGDKGGDDGTGPLGQPSLSGPCLPLESLHMAGRIRGWKLYPGPPMRTSHSPLEVHPPGPQPPGSAQPPGLLAFLEHSKHMPPSRPLHVLLPPPGRSSPGSLSGWLLSGQASLP